MVANDENKTIDESSRNTANRCCRMTKISAHGPFARAARWAYFGTRKKVSYTVVNRRKLSVRGSNFGACPRMILPPHKKTLRPSHTLCGSIT